ncbi:hypothetical protein C1H46_010027 [Malus baccata]|uniref:Endonuclease/exonuclease/phosphatase domain-containing protein n=1 Tax=Malus baccata TaxID=106549 RepID=A0A540N027_MALBA|nr:hypothetical protein C1H46_010027 [Malus baccata]
MGYINGIDVAPVGRAGGLSLWWDDTVQVNVRDSSKHFIDVTCSIVDLQRVFRFTGVYGTSYRSEKVDFWRGMIQNFGSNDTPWICGGDFNEFLWDHEKSGGAEVRYNRTRYLEEFMSKLEILDFGYNGPKFTWRGKRNGQLVEARLDRALGNENWQVLWPNCLVSIGTMLGSDHNPVIVHCAPKVDIRKKIFRFEAYWANEDDCKEIVRQVWVQPQEGNSVERWSKKICDCFKWPGRKFSQRHWKIQKLMSHLGRLQMDWRSNSQEIEDVSKAVDTLWSQEESVWKQKSRVQWLQEGDANTKFFHQSTLQRRRRNKVVTLKSDNEEKRSLVFVLVENDIATIHSACIKETVIPKFDHAVNGLLRGGGTSSSSEDLHVFEGEVVGLLPFPPSKKRYRRKFTVEQKERMRVEDSEAG